MSAPISHDFEQADINLVYDVMRFRNRHMPTPDYCFDVAFVHDVVAFTELDNDHRPEIQAMTFDDFLTEHVDWFDLLDEDEEDDKEWLEVAARVRASIAARNGEVFP